MFQSIRSSIHSQLSTIRITSYRNIGYLHRGERIRGLIRDESEYLLNPNGLKYNLESILPLKQYLSTLLENKSQINDELLLQISTHKSFAHGSKPFNEKLAIYGGHFLKYKTSLFAIQTGGIDSLGSKTSKDLISRKVLAEFIRKNELNQGIYWKKRDQLLTDSSINGEDSVFATVLEALIGGLLLNKGKLITEKFINERLLNETDPNSLINIAKNIK
ncbi:hypothetical protein WICMUC_002515 [Wickerhamomyces mucosus]|uniref:RNase III domain-containing protein n=1 Tax=Wickerhamomyces mucosus TaxID=1378264 RepID=A0A9P8TDQ3_9ASCO|nr:hypothetical protein WICMUC_002515 [Wickerhamomyces mucosus]